MSDALAGFSRIAFPTIRDADTVRLEEDAAARGHAAGYAAGLRAASAETAALRASLAAETEAAVSHSAARTDRAMTVLTTAAATLEARRAALRTEAQEALVATALQLAEAILGYELRTNASSTVVAALARALEIVDPAEIVQVRLHPADLAVLDASPSISTAQDLGVAFAADPALSRGDAIADLADGFVDAALGSALTRARGILLGGAA